MDQTLDSMIAESKVWSQRIAERLLRPNQLHSLLIFGLSAYFGLSDGLGERLNLESEVTQCP